MDARRRVVLGVFCGAMLIPLAGCFWGPPVGSRLNNDGGGDRFTALAKVVGGNMTTLNGDEIQMLADFVMEQAGLTGVEPLTDEQSLLIKQFVRDNNLDTIEDIENLVDNPGDVVISDDLLAALQVLFGAEVDGSDLEGLLP